MKLAFRKISPLVENQFPAFYREDGSLFVEFVKSYYEWLEDTNNPLYYSRQLLSIRDIDETFDEFLPHFQRKYIPNGSIGTFGNKRDLIKHSSDFYRTKGTEQALRLLFSALYGDSIEVYYPGNDVLRASDGKWTQPKYIEVSVSDRTASFVGKDIVGSVSGARAFVESVLRRSNDGKFIDVVYLDNVRGNFQTGELISTDSNTTNSPTIVGSMTSIEITVAGSQFAVGEVLDVVSSFKGKQGQALVTNTGIKTGEVTYLLQDGGYGYTDNANVAGDSQKVFISSNVFSYTAFTSNTTTVNSFSQFTTIKQPLMNVVFTASNTTFTAETLVYGANATNNILAAGFVLASSQTGANGWALVSPHNVALLTIAVESGANAVSGSFLTGETIYQEGTSGNSAIGLVVFANSTAVTVDQKYGPYVTGTVVIGRNSNCYANVTALTTVSNTISFSNTNITKIITSNTAGATKGAVSDISATANVIASNNQAVGVISVSGTFTAANKNFIYDTTTNATAQLTAIGSGNPGSFKIGGISNTEVVFLNTDKLADKNSGNVSFLTINLNANNSNAASNTGYGFTQYPTANLSSVIDLALTKTQLVIGSIKSIRDVNAGANNTASPFSLEIEKSIAAFGRRELSTVLVSNTTGVYRLGELVIQNKTQPAVQLGVTGISNTFLQNRRELIKQVRSDGVTVYGELRVASVVANSGILTISVANTSNTFNTSNTIVGMVSTANATVANITNTTVSTQSKGNIEEINNDTLLIKRRSFDGFDTSNILEGTESGITGSVIQVIDVESANVVGNNAIVSSEAGVANGTIVSVDVISSGFFYEDGEVVELSTNTNPIKAQGTVVCERQGQSPGYWRNNDGKLDENKFIQDNDYYQEYSYEIRSGINRTVYETGVKETAHVAGTKMFSNFLKVSTNPEGSNRIAPGAYTLIVTANLANTSTGTFIVGEQVTQGNNAVGYVLKYSSVGAINTLDLTEVQGSFNTTTDIIGANTGAIGVINNLTITIM